MSEHAWIFVSEREDWRTCEEAGIFAIGTQPQRLSTAESGDPVVAYVKRELVFAGFGELTSSYYKAKGSELKDGFYPHRVKLNIKLDFENAIDVRKLIEELDFIKNKDNWYSRFQRGIFQIPYTDFEIIKASIEKKQIEAKTREQETSPNFTEKMDIIEAIESKTDLSASSTHDRLAEMIHRVGLLMGYESIQRYMTTPSSPYRIDVAWLQNKNPQIAIEIQHGGSVEHALEILRHAKKFNFRKVILVLYDPSDHRRAVSILRFDDDLKHVIDLWSFKSIYEMYTNCVSFHSSYGKFDKSVYKEDLNEIIS